MSNIWLENEVKKLEAMVGDADARLAAREKMISEKETRFRQGLIKNNSAKDLHANLRTSLDPVMVPGNVGDMNRVLWPFYFTTKRIDLAPNTAASTNFSVTQEAGFVWLALIKTVYEKNPGTGELTYIDPDVVANDLDFLKFTIRDAQSSRAFQNLPMSIDHVGNPRWPTVLGNPTYLLPNASVEILFNNNHGANHYVPYLTFLGYRVRSENAKDLLSTVYG